ncbi:pyridoxamine 5'-phosphate oxidase family protein [Paenibacillus macerans]|uniref:pyridoxamine 5'-phosphate oxidase family protein n=1 Tax=Paenibacillus macerans TaxID=44252 RepID=UPI003D3197C8
MKFHTLSALLMFTLIFSACSDNNNVLPASTPMVKPTTTASPAPPLNKINSEDTAPIFVQDYRGLDDNMKRIVEFLTDHKEVQMATVGIDGKPAIRTIQFQLYENGRIYFQTDTNASLYEDLQKYPYIEFVSSNSDYTESLRISAKVVFEYNYNLLKLTLDRFPNIKKIYGSADNPILTMFYIDHGLASIYEFSNERQETTLRYEW